MIYRIAPATEVVRLDAETVAIKSPNAAVKLTGASATLFENQIYSAIDGKTSCAQIAANLGLRYEQLESLMRQLYEADILLAAVPLGTTESDFLEYTSLLGLDRPIVAKRLAGLKIAIFGMGQLGQNIATCLAQTGIGQLTLCDPYPLESTQAQNQEVCSRLSRYSCNLVVPANKLSEEEVAHIAQGQDALVSAFGARFPAVDHWVNRAAHVKRIPALFCRITAHGAGIGPMVFPGETACFTCWQMRSMACVDNFPTIIAYEEKATSRDQPYQPAPIELGYLAASAAGMAVNELIKALFAVGRQKVTDATINFDPIKAVWSENPVLRRQDCPVCSKKKISNPPQPIIEKLPKQEKASLLKYKDHLVSNVSGIVRSLERVHKDITEPAFPYIYRAEIANHRFMDDPKDAFIVASGKGFSHKAGQLSALGEAVERYASANWDEDRIFRGAASDINYQVLDPSRLVLFAEHQYNELKYDPYSSDKPIGWVKVRSLTSGKLLAVPALAVLMAYETQGKEPFLFPITSNGLAAGATLADAILSGAYEVIERDTFLYVWLNMLPSQRVDSATHPSPEIRSMVLSYARRGVQLELFRLPTDHDVFVFMGIAVDENAEGNGPAAVVGLGASHDPVRAAASALVEAVQVRPALRIKLRQNQVCRRLGELLENPQAVTSLEDHDLLYSNIRMLGQFDFLRNTEVSHFDWEIRTPKDPRQCLQHLNTQLSEIGTELLYANLTSHDIAHTGVSVVRVIIPDFQPMHFGFKERRLAATRLYAMPQVLGFQQSPSQIKNLNPFPHPLA